MGLYNSTLNLISVKGDMIMTQAVMEPESTQASNDSGFKCVLEKGQLLDVLGNIIKVATRNIKQEFQFQGLVTIQAKKGELIFISSNGFLDVKTIVPIDKKSEIGTGKVTVKVDVLTKVASALGGSSKDIPLLMEVVKDVLHIKAKGSKSKKKAVKIETHREHHRASFKKPTGKTFAFDSSMLVRGIETVSRFTEAQQRNHFYQNVLFHFYPDEIRLVSGTGVWFCVYSYKPETPNNVPEQPPNAKYPDITGYQVCGNQLDSIVPFLDMEQETEITFKDTTQSYIQNGNTTFVAKATPSDQWGVYWPLCDELDTKFIVDIDYEDLKEVIEIANAVEDEELVKQRGTHHSVRCDFKEGEEAEFVVDEGRYQAEVSVPCRYHNLSDESKDYSSKYAVLFFSNLARIKTTPFHHVRFLCDDQDGVLNMQLVDLEETEDDKLPDVVPFPENYSVRIFFACDRMM